MSLEEDLLVVETSLEASGDADERNRLNMLIVQCVALVIYGAPAGAQFMGYLLSSAAFVMLPRMEATYPVFFVFFCVWLIALYRPWMGFGVATLLSAVLLAVRFLYLGLGIAYFAISVLGLYLALRLDAGKMDLKELEEKREELIDTLEGTPPKGQNAITNEPGV